MADLTPYSTAKPLMGVLETWLPADDAERIASYQLYEAIFKNVPDAFRVIQRGSEQNPIYIPSGRTIIEACNRFLAKRWDYNIDPELGTPQERDALELALSALFVREEMYSKFSVSKKWGLIRGDAVWHITANPNKAEGTRISIHQVDPASYFPIFDAVNDTKVVGAHLVDQFDNDGEIVLRRQTYRKDQETQKVSYEVTWWAMGAWDDREGSGQDLEAVPPPPNFTGIPAFDLPDQITSIPIYHIKNDPSPDAPYGTSELAGLERVIAAVNQAISDEELALALDGLGVYKTTSGPPVDDDGNETDWQIGPGYVVEIDEDSDFDRVSGVTSVDPVMSHLGYLDRAMREASGTPDVAVGRVDAQTAESGVALLLQMAPMLSKNEEKEQVILSTMDHMLFDLSTMWLPAYEVGISGNAIAHSIVDDPLPLNRTSTLEEIILMVNTKLISLAYARILVKEKLGYDIPEDVMTQIAQEQQALAATDPWVSRVNQELDGGAPTTEEA